MKPKGKIFLIGGAESEGDNEYLDVGGKNIKYQRYEILKEILNGAQNKRIEIITTASREQGEVRRRYQNAFHDIDYPDPGFLQINETYEAEQEKYLARIKEAEVVFFTGGDQSRLIHILRDTPLIKAIKHKFIHDEQFLIAGTSAGAMALSSIMIAKGGREEALFNKDLELTDGFGFIDSCIIDSHFIKRGRFSRLAHAIIDNPEKLGLGLGEDTAILIRNGVNAECLGSGMVVIIDGQHIGETNIKQVVENEPIYVENLIVHLLIKGCVFCLNTRKLFKEATIGQCT